MYGKLGVKCWICKGENKPMKDKTANVAVPIAPIGPAEAAAN